MFFKNLYDLDESSLSIGRVKVHHNGHKVSTSELMLFMKISSPIAFFASFCIGKISHEQHKGYKQ